MPSTSRGYPYPSGSDDVDIPGDIQALADAVNTDVGTIATTTPSAPVLQTLADAAGDLPVGSAADVFGKLAIGTDNYALTVNTAGSGVAKVGWEDPTANPLTTAALALKVNTSTVGNLLIANLANGSESGSVAADEPVDCSVASSTAQAKSGTRSIAQTAAAAYCSARMTDVTGFTAGQTYTFSAQARANASGETAEVTVLWRDSGGAGIGGVVSVNAAVVSTGWTRLINTTVAPAGAVTATIYLGKSGANGTVLYWDELGAWQGAGGQWDLPGTPITNLGFYTDESVGRRLFQWDANNARWQMTYGDTGWRDVTSLVNVSGWTNAPTALAVYVRRTLEQSSMIVQWNAGTGSCSGEGILTLPSGFGPAASIIAPAGSLNTTDGANVGGWYWATGTTLNLTSPATSVVARTITTLPCSAAWPTTLPGTASGSIPA